MPRILAMMGATNPFIEVKTALVRLISINLKVLPKNVEKLPTASNPSKGILPGLPSGILRKKIGHTIMEAIVNDAPVKDTGEHRGIFCINMPPVASRTLAIIQNDTDKRLEVIPIVELLLLFIRKIRPETPIKKPIHLFNEISSLRINLANSRMKRGIEDKYIATSPVVRVFKANGIKINGRAKHKLPYTVE